MANTKIIEKINKQCESLQKKIDGLSGNYLTNTRKRQAEQKHRDNMKEQYRQRLEFLSYLKKEVVSRELTLFENALITGTFYDDIKNFSIRRQYNQNNSNSTLSSIQFSSLNEDYRKAFEKIGISNTDELNDALDKFDDILRQAVTPTDPEATRLRDLMFSARLHQGGDIQFTPEPLAERIVTLAGIMPDSKVLEPEAGIASIADKAKEITPDVDCVEIMSDFREILKLKAHNLVAYDLFEYEQCPVYDAVVMNPPFSKEIDHIKYAFGFLKPGGSLVAVCSKRFTFIKNSGYPEFREWLEQNNLYYEDVSEKFEMTGTAAVILKIKNV